LQSEKKLCWTFWLFGLSS